MKPIKALILIAIFSIGCNNDEELNIEDRLSEGFHIVIGDKVVIGPDDIDYYDYSTHLIYLKEPNKFSDNLKNYDGITVYADGDKIYNGNIYQQYSSYLPTGAILNYPLYYGDYNLNIGFGPLYDSLGNPTVDPRDNARIVDALKRDNKFHEGLKSTIKSVEYASAGNVSVELELQNDDAFNYYYLDPDKMGNELFHYFTNGLSIIDFKNKTSYTNNIKPTKLEPRNIWKKEWLSLIESGETKTLSLTYGDFEEVPPGQFKATIKFPGLGGQVNRADLQQVNGRIWLGELELSRDVTIE